MAKFLSDLLAAKEPLFTRSLQQLEQASHRQGIDARLAGEIHEKIARALKRLELDPSDTTGPELYHALIARVAEHDMRLAQALGGSNPDSVAEMLPLIAKKVKSVDMPRDCWVIKKSVAKRFLHDMPPKNIMKRLGYRSVDSMLKREKLAEIYGALRFAEEGEWLREFNTKYETLKPTDFEKRTIEIVEMSRERWGDIAEHFIAKKRHNITHLKELGVILILPINQPRMKGITLKILPLLLHYFNEIRLYSAFFKLKQVSPNFGRTFVETLNADPDLGPIMAGQHIHWRVIQRYFGKLEGVEYHPEIFEPHVQPEDLHWRKAEEVLYKIDPELEFWRDMDYVAQIYDGRPVAFNLMDVSLSYSNNVPYGKQYIYHFRESLWNEIFVRYMGQKTLEDQVLKQLDNDMIKPEALASLK